MSTVKLFQESASGRAAAFVALVAGVVLGWALLIPAAATLAGGLYAAELAIADAPLDVAVPAVAAGLLLCTELGYWSLEGADALARRGRRKPAAGRGRRAARRGCVPRRGDSARARGRGARARLALDLIGALAAVTVLATVVLVARGGRQPSNGA